MYVSLNCNVCILWLRVLLTCVDVMVMSSVYKVSCSGAGGYGMSDVYMLRRVGERTPPLWTPVLNWRCIDACSMKVKHALRPLM